MQRNRQPSEELFLKDVAQHEMTVLLDQGVYRHLRFKRPESGIAWFDIITWPGRLTYTGDMGTFVFARLEDMFQFFRTDARADKLGINPGYWGEKLQAVDRDGQKSSHMRFSADRVREQIEEQIKEWLEDMPEPFEADEEEFAPLRKAFEEALREAIEDDVDGYLEDNEYEAHKALRDFSFEYQHKAKTKPTKYEFSETWEWNTDDYTYRFMWCCYALAWAIKTYDASKTPAPQQEVVHV